MAITICLVLTMLFWRQYGCYVEFIDGNARRIPDPTSLLLMTSHAIANTGIATSIPRLITITSKHVVPLNESKMAK